MKVFQKALLVSVLSLGVSYPSFAAEINPVSRALMDSMSADIKSLTNIREDVQNLQVTMKEMVAEQKKFHRDFLRLVLQIHYGTVEMSKEARELFKESLAELEDSPLEEKNN